MRRRTCSPTRVADGRRRTLGLYKRNAATVSTNPASSDFLPCRCSPAGTAPVSSDGSPPSAPPSTRFRRAPKSSRSRAAARRQPAPCRSHPSIPHLCWRHHNGSGELRSPPTLLLAGTVPRRSHPTIRHRRDAVPLVNATPGANPSRLSRLLLYSSAQPPLLQPLRAGHHRAEAATGKRSS